MINTMRILYCDPKPQTNNDVILDAIGLDMYKSILYSLFNVSYLYRLCAFILKYSFISISFIAFRSSYNLLKVFVDDVFLLL